MSFRREVVTNVAVQAIGPASAFLTVFMVARLGGPADQGQFAQVKALVDVLVALGCFGFPQGFVYAVNKVGASAAALARWSRFYALVFVPVAFGGCLLAWRLGYLGAPASGWESVLVLTVAAAGLVLHGLWRGVYLTHSTGVSFAIFTILPALALLFATGAGMAAGMKLFDWMVLGSSLPTVAIAARMMRPIEAGRPSGQQLGQPWGPILTNGLHSFAQAMLMTLQPLAAYGLARLHGASSREIGFLNVGMFLAQALVVPITMVSPLLFARWTSTVQLGLLDSLRTFTVRALALDAALGAILSAAALWVVPLLFGGDYRPAVISTQIVLLTLPLVCHVRIIAPALHASGHPGINTVAFGLRIGVFVSLASVLPRAWPNPVLATSLAWTLAEMASAGVILLGLRSAADAPRNEPLTESQ